MSGLETILLATAALLIAGTIKGFVGLGLPTVSLALLSLVFAPREAMGLILVPMLMTNFWQMLRGPDLMGVMMRYWRFAVVLAICVSATIWFSQSASNRVLILALGFVVLAFVAVSWRDLVPAVPPHLERPVEFALAAFAGLIGGLTAAWAAPMAMYLKTRKVSPDEFVQASGFLITAGSLPFIIMFLVVGHYEISGLGVSATLLIPTLAGFTIGERLRRGIDPKAFHRVLMIVFLGFGLNLIYRGLFSAG